MKLDPNDMFFGDESVEFDGGEFSTDRVLASQLEDLISEDAEKLFATASEKDFSYDDTNSPEMSITSSETHFKAPKQDRVAQDKAGAEYLEGFVKLLVETGTDVQEIRSSIIEKFGPSVLVSHKALIARTIHQVKTERERLSGGRTLLTASHQFAEGHAVGSRESAPSGINRKTLLTAKTFVDKLQSCGWFDKMSNLYMTRFPSGDIKGFRKDLKSAVAFKFKDIVTGKNAVIAKTADKVNAEYLPGKDVIVAVAHALNTTIVDDRMIDELAFTAGTVVGDIFRDFSVRAKASRRIVASGANQASADLFDSMSDSVTDGQDFIEALDTKKLLKAYVSKTALNAKQTDVDLTYTRGVSASRKFLETLKTSGWIGEIRVKYATRFPKANMLKFDESLVKVISKSMNEYLLGKGLVASTYSVSKDFYPSRETLAKASDAIRDDKLVTQHLDSFSHIVSASVYGLFTEASLASSKGQKLSREDFGDYTTTARQYFEDAMPSLDIDASVESSGYELSDVDYGENSFLDKESNASLEIDGDFFDA